MRRSVFVLAALVLMLAMAACGSDDTSTTSSDATTTPTPATPTTPAATAAEPVVKEVLADMVDPPGGDGSTLTLIRYTIAPGAQLDPHIHPGVQLAAIESGTLAYTVESGTAVVHRADGTTENIDGPAETSLEPGDAVQEIDGMVHFGANDTDDPVVILATLLTEDGHELAEVVEEPTTSTTP